MTSNGTARRSRPAAWLAGAFPALIVLSLVTSFLVVVLGGVVRVTGSGLGCPDWPLCYGQVIPPLRLDAWIEYIHRLSAAVVSLVVALAAVAGWVRFRQRRAAGELWLLGGALALLLAQVLLGAATVLGEIPPAVAATHLAVAMAFVGLLALSTAGAVRPLTFVTRRLRTAAGRGVSLRSYRLALLGYAALAFTVVVAGALVTRSGAAAACAGFPLCDTVATTDVLQRLQDIHMGHRYLAYLLTGYTVVMIWMTLRLPVPAVRPWTGWITLAVSVQVVLGAVNILAALPEWSRAGHVVFASLVFASIMLLLGAVWRARDAEGAVQAAAGNDPDTAGAATEPDGEVPVGSAGVTARSTLANYVLLTKPGIIVLLLVTTLGGMLASGGEIGLATAFWTMVAGAFCAGGATTLNSWIDWDIDQVMRRTRRRPVPAGVISRGAALRFGVTLAVLSIVIFAVFVNLISALLAAVAFLYYVLLYSAYLKRHTFHSVVIGGAAGAFPPLIGWTAVTGAIEPGALFLFLIVFFWTPPHAWALTLLMKDDYARARVPMLPVALGDRETHRQIVLYSVSMLAITLIPASLRLFGLFYLGVALVLGLVFLAYAILVYRAPSARRVLGLYRYSSLYLALIFLGLVIDRNLFVA